MTTFFMKRAVQSQAKDLMGSAEDAGKNIELGNITESLLGNKEMKKRLKGATNVRNFELNRLLETLRIIHKACGGEKAAKEDDAPDMKDWSAFEKERYYMTKLMKDTRDNLVELDKAEKSGEPRSFTTPLKNNVRKQLRELTLQKKKLKTLADKEGKTAEANKVFVFFTKTEALYKQRFTSGAHALSDVAEPEGDEEGDDFGTSRPVGLGRRGQRALQAAPSHTLGSGNNEDFRSCMEDPEFQELFEEVSRKDQEIEDLLDVNLQGVKRLHQHAVGFSDELDRQDEMLNQMEVLVDKNKANLEGLNTKLEKVTKQVKADQCCMYIVCCVLLLAVIGGVFAAVKSLGIF
eukprot:NODE_1219_length_1517_cov_6.893733_g1014_i0.p1 GENE.NODE_1219_length_1517_cov_6.893733_g1014_i0~~NODE_1219_length_1517_cov_6.893733_g1014_i0.p1  ORF type:complete len:348 (+),score=81.44 NODE_1219_length_1517_cov_6.893733_g1014_i0:416-1459(+)